MTTRFTNRIYGTVILAIILTTIGAKAAELDDPRTTVMLPANIAAKFMAEMRSHMANLDDLVAALAEGDFAAAARVADIHMTFGHRRWAQMAERGASDKEIAAAKKDFKQMRGSRSGKPGQARGKGVARGKGMRRGKGMGHGFGRFMPEEFRAMGTSFHEAADAFAKAARAAASPPTSKDYSAVLEELGGVTAACRSCHDAFRITAGK